MQVGQHLSSQTQQPYEGGLFKNESQLRIRQSRISNGENLQQIAKQPSGSGTEKGSEQSAKELSGVPSKHE